MIDVYIKIDNSYIKLITILEACRILKRSKLTVYRYLNHTELFTKVKIGRNVFLREDELRIFKKSERMRNRDSKKTQET